MKNFSQENIPQHGYQSVILEDGDAFTPDFSIARAFRILYSGTITVNDPINAKPNVPGRLEFISTANGAVVNFGANYIEAAQITADESYADIVEGYATEFAGAVRTIYAFAVTNQTQSAAEVVVYDYVNWQERETVDDMDPVTVTYSDGSFHVPHTENGFTFTDNDVAGVGVDVGVISYDVYGHYGKWIIQPAAFLLDYTAAGDIAAIDPDDTVTHGDGTFTVNYDVHSFTFTDDAVPMIATYDGSVWTIEAV